MGVTQDLFQVAATFRGGSKNEQQRHRRLKQQRQHSPSFSIPKSFSFPCACVRAVYADTCVRPSHNTRSILFPYSLARRRLAFYFLDPSPQGAAADEPFSAAAAKSLLGAAAAVTITAAAAAAVRSETSPGK